MSKRLRIQSYLQRKVKQGVIHPQIHLYTPSDTPLHTLRYLSTHPQIPLYTPSDTSLHTLRYTSTHPKYSLAKCIIGYVLTHHPLIPFLYDLSCNKSSHSSVQQLLPSAITRGGKRDKATTKRMKRFFSRLLLLL